MITIVEARSPDEIEEVRRLFCEYEASLGLDLCFQGFDEELRTLPGRYAPPEGRLYLALVDEVPAGCMAMRKLAEDICEMKRLYLRPQARGRGLGNRLIETLVTEARIEGYQTMRLDTDPVRMGKAVSLYRSHGFQRIDAYYHNPHDGVVFMELAL